MKRSHKPSHRVAAPQPAFRLSPVAAGATMMLMAMGAHAQTAPATSSDAQVIEVTGIRRGIENAINVKKNADGVVEAISAEDIGKLPDTTIAESLARLPGVTTQRTKSGNASTISIRGLGPDFNGYLLNGREQTSTGDSRAADLSVYPAELIGGATVYKTGDASLMAAGLAGTIDNKLIDPLAFGGRVFAAQAQKITTGKGLPVTGSGHRYSLSYIDQFADRKVGVALGFVRVDGSSNQLQSGGWGGNTVSATLTNGTVVPGVTVPAPFGGGLDFRNYRFDDKRDGAAAILSFKPNKDLTSQLDLFYSKLKLYTKMTRLTGGLPNAVTNATVANGQLVTGTFTLPASPGGLIVYPEGITDDDKVNSVGWRTSWNFAPTWSATVDLSHNTAKRIEKDNEYYAGLQTADTLTVDYSGGGSQPKLTLGNPTAYTNPATILIRDQTGWSGVNFPASAGAPLAGTPVPQAGYSKGPNITDKIDAVRLDLKHDLSGGAFSGVQFGGNYSKRTKDRVTDEGLIVSATGVGRDPFAYPSGSYVEKTVGGSGIDVLTFDPGTTIIPTGALLRKYNDDILSKTWGIQEKVTTAYAKLDIDTEVSGGAAKIPVRGNVGVQVVNTDQSSTGYQAQVGSGVVLNNPATALTRDGVKYTDVLPSLNLAGELGGGNVLRLGLGKQIARASLTDLRNSFAASVDTNAANTATFGRFVGSAGNPFLKPFKATAFDLSLESYVGTKAYYSAAFFYKKLDTYITTATNTAYDFTSYANRLGLTIPPAGPLGTFTTSVNGNGGNLYGIELAASVPFNLLTKALDGFGASISYSNTDSSVTLPNTTGQNPNQQVPTSAGTIPLPGLSKENAKLMLYYEKGGFSAFVASNYRSTYVGSVANDAIGGYPTLRWIDGSYWLSAQIGYEVQSGPAKGLGIRFEGNNLNKPTYRQFQADGKTLDFEQKTGASVAIKVSYKYQ